MKAKFIKSAKVQGLYANVEANLELYRAGSFGFLGDDSSYHFETSLEVDEGKLLEITCQGSDFREVENCILMFEAMGDITHYLARDERLWIYLCHTSLLPYSRMRWPIPQDKEKAIKHIRAHFFCVGARAVERDNAASRLWWQASLCHRATGISFKDALTCFLHQSDVRANIVERPTTAQNVLVFSTLIKRLHNSYQSNKRLFERETFRNLMKELNLIGGVKLLAALPEVRIAQILDDCITRSTT